MNASADISARLAQATDGARISALLDRLRAELGYTQQVSVPLPIGHAGPLYCALAEDHESDEVVGLLSAQRCHNMVRGIQYILVTDVYVLGDYRRRGVATLLMNEALALGRRLGASHVYLIIEKPDEAILATASRAGFINQEDLLLTCELD